jgi:hypothetical protein
MSQLKEQYERETGKCWHLTHQTFLLPAERYVNWLEAKVENGSSHNSAMDAICPHREVCDYYKKATLFDDVVKQHQ